MVEWDGLDGMHLEDEINLMRVVSQSLGRRGYRGCRGSWVVGRGPVEQGGSALGSMR